MRTLILTSFLACAAPAALLAQSADSMPPSDSRIRVLVYDESDVYTITTKYGYQTNVVFAEREEIETISVGDRSMWQIIPAGHRLFIRPMEENVTTNMTVLTNRRSYNFDLKSTSSDDKGSGNIYVAKFLYPEDMPKRSREDFIEPPVMAAPPPAMPVAVGSIDTAKPVHPNYNYTFTGPDEKAPVQVYDDGASTFIKYRDLPSPMPGIYTADAGGERKIAYLVKDGMLVMDEVVGKFLLRDKTTTVTVYNEMLNPR